MPSEDHPPWASFEADKARTIPRQPLGRRPLAPGTPIGWRLLRPLTHVPRAGQPLAATTQSGDLSAHSAVGADAGRHPNSTLHKLRRRLIAGTALAALLALLLLLVPGKHDHSARSHPIARPLTEAGTTTPGLAGVGMPQTLPGDIPVKSIRVVLVIDRTYTPTTEQRELAALGNWLQSHANRGTRVTVLDTPRLAMTRALPVALLRTAQPRHHEREVAAAVRAAFRAGHGRRLLVTLNLPNPPRIRGVTTLRLTSRHGANQPGDLGLQPGKPAHAFIDARRSRTFAATTARAVILVSNMRERR